MVFWWSNRIAFYPPSRDIFFELTMAWHREACPLWRAVRARFADHEAGLCGKPWVTRRSVLNGRCGGLFRHGKLNCFFFSVFFQTKSLFPRGGFVIFLPSQDYFHFSMGQTVKLREWNHLWSGMFFFQSSSSQPLEELKSSESLEEPIRREAEVKAWERNRIFFGVRVATPRGEWSREQLMYPPWN